MSDDSPPRLLPVVDDLDTGGFFEAAARGELVLRRCDDCDAVLHVPRACTAVTAELERSLAARRRQRDALLLDRSSRIRCTPPIPTPYTVVLVDLDEAPGTHLVGQVPGTPDLHAGMPMELWFEELGRSTAARQSCPTGAPFCLLQMKPRAP